MSDSLPMSAHEVVGSIISLDKRKFNYNVSILGTIFGVC